MQPRKHLGVVAGQLAENQIVDNHIAYWTIRGADWFVPRSSAPRSQRAAQLNTIIASNNVERSAVTLYQN